MVFPKVAEGTTNLVLYIQIVIAIPDKAHRDCRSSVTIHKAEELQLSDVSLWHEDGNEGAHALLTTASKSGKHQFIMAVLQVAASVLAALAGKLQRERSRLN